MPQTTTQTKQYKVQGPDGVPHVIEGPDGATDDEIIQQAMKLFGTSPSKRPSALDKLQTEHPYLTSPLRFLEGVGGAAIGTVTGIKSAATMTEEDKAAHPDYPLPVVPPGVFLKRLLLDPQLEQAEKAKEAGKNFKIVGQRPVRGNAANFLAYGSEALGHGLAAITPVVGPMAANLTEQAVSGQLPEALGGAAFGIGLGSILNELGTKTKSPAKPSAMPSITSERQLNSFASQIKSGVGEESVHSVAQTAIPVFQKAASELGTNLEQSVEAKFPVRAPTEAGKQAVRTAGEHALDIADHAVDISDRPFKEVLQSHGEASTNRPQFGAVKTPQVQAAVLGKLENLARENDKVNQPLADAIRSLAERVQSSGDTFSGLNDLKVLANKKSSGLFSKSLGAQLNASGDVAYAWKALGDVIRSEMYPELSRISGVDLRQAGATEAAVMDARDGLRKTYYKEVLPAHAQFMAQTYLERLSGGSLYHHNLIRRALGLNPTPAGEFNKLFRRGLGDVPPTPNSVPIYPGRGPEVETLTGTQHDLIPTGAPGSEPLLAPPPGTANRYTSPSGSTLAEDIFRVQQRANREARLAPPPTIAGRQIPIAENALPDKEPPFYPGNSSANHIEIVRTPDGKPVIGADGQPLTAVRDYSKQRQLFTIEQSHPMMEGVHYTASDGRRFILHQGKWYEIGQGSLNPPPGAH